MVLCVTLKYRGELEGKRKMRSLYTAKPQRVYVIRLLALEWLRRPTAPLRARSLVKTSDGFRFTTRMYLSVFEPSDCQTQRRFVVSLAWKNAKFRVFCSFLSVSAISRSCFSQANPPFYIMGKMRSQLFSGGLFVIQIHIDFPNLMQPGVSVSSRQQVFCLSA